MILDRIRIVNFRSIKDATITFDNNGLILIGKNEAGKSNILKAIAALFGEYQVSNKDKRKRIQNEIIDCYYIRAVFKLSKADKQRIKSDFEKEFNNVHLIEFENGKKLDDYVNTFFDEFLLQLDIENNEFPHFLYWKIDETRKFVLKDKIYLLQDGITLLKEPTSKEFDLLSYCFEKCKEIYNDEPYLCHFWKYSNNYLLPHDISIPNFIANPNSCIPLNNIFVLCNRGNIKQEFQDALSEDGDYANLLEQISTEITNIFRKIWKDFKNTRIEFVPSGNEIITKVTEKAKYSFEDRSDGFKKFITILLMLSTKSRSNGLTEHDIILIDEPDQSLYPTSAKYLKDELLKISEKSYVVYTTHSQYMLDTNNIQRHLIVKKENDITTIIKPTELSQYSEDELLLQSIGTSIFECLKEKNFIFEGWLDKQVFDRYCLLKRKTKLFSNVGKVFLGGISGAETLAQILILANKKFIIIADSDDASISKKKSFIERYPEYNNSWIEYKECESSIKTLEDFFNIDYIEKLIKRELIKNFTYDNSKTAIDNIKNAANSDKTKIQNLKKSLVKEFTINDLTDAYSKFIKILENRIS